MSVPLRFGSVVAAALVAAGISDQCASIRSHVITVCHPLHLCGAGVSPVRAWSFAQRQDSEVPLPPQRINDLSAKTPDHGDRISRDSEQPHAKSTGRETAEGEATEGGQPNAEAAHRDAAQRKTTNGDNTDG